jgi:ribosome-associated translation inhibitor RaiA
MDLVPDQVKSIEEQFRKVAKLLDGKSRNGVGEQEAHIRLSHERHLHHVEVTMNFHNHALVSNESNADLASAIHGAVYKLECQAIKVTKKWCDAKRVTRPAARSDAAD